MMFFEVEQPVMLVVVEKHDHHRQPDEQGEEAQGVEARQIADVEPLPDGAR
jgi:hypothetical protein